MRSLDEPYIPTEEVDIQKVLKKLLYNSNFGTAMYHKGTTFE